MPERPIDQDGHERSELFAQVARLLSAQGVEVDELATALMRPLLDGSADYAQHLAFLEAEIEKLEPHD